jgi:tetratricopeptide (TPR) repeat protein
VISVLPWLAMSVPVVVIGRLSQPAHALPFIPPFQFRPLVAADAVGFYVRQLLAPVSLCIDYGRSPLNVLAASSTVVTVVIAVGVVAVLYLARRSRAVVAGAAVFFACLIPVLGFVPFDFQQYSTTSDHYLYLAMLGPALVLAHVLRGRGLVVASVVLVVLAARSFVQTWVWADSATLFAHTLEVNPRSSAARTNLAIALTEANRLPEAGGQYRAALAINFADPKAHLGLGQSLARLGQPERALAHLRAAVAIEPENPLPHYNVGLLLASLDRGDEALPEYERALALDPGFAEAHTNLATLFLTRGNLEAAEGHYRAALALRPELAIPRRGLEAIGQLRGR